MSGSSYEITHEKILDSGRELFLKNGYERTNLRALCKGAGITTGAFYRHFQDKEALFGALVEPAIEGIHTMYADSEKQCFDFIEEEDIKSLFEISNETVASFIHFIYSQFDCFKLLLQCADGTKHVSFTNDLVDLEVANTIKMIEVMKEHHILVNEISVQELHMLCHTYFTFIFESVMHDYTEAEAIKYTHTMVDFFTAGWKKVLGL